MNKEQTVSLNTMRKIGNMMKQCLHNSYINMCVGYMMASKRITNKKLSYR